MKLQHVRRTFPILVGMLIAVSAPAWAWNQSVAQEWENTLGPVMQENKSEILLSTVTSELGDTSPAALAKLGIAYHNLSVIEFNKGWAKKSVEVLKPLSQSGIPDELQAIVLCYLGSATGMEARDDWFPITKLILVNQAFGILDDAVNRFGTESYYPELMRSEVDWGVPEFFNKRSQAKADLKDLLNWKETHGESVADGVLASAELLQGNIYKSESHINQAVVAWKLALQYDPTKSGPGKDAADLIDRYEN